MEIEFLGTGGAITIPRPGCPCDLCREARTKGIPYSRSGPSLFVHGPNVLIDTPEEIKDQLNRAQLGPIDACLYSHWHPDHTMGRRVWEMNQDWRQWPPNNHTTDIYLPQQVAVDFQARLGLKEHFEYMASHRLVRLHQVTDGTSISLNQTIITPIRLSEDYVYAFLFETESRRLLVAPDELYGWQPPGRVQNLDLAILPMGILEFDVWSGARRIPAEHPVLRREATLRQTLAITRQLNARQVYLTHIEEPDQMGYSDLLRLEEKLQAEGYPIRFAYDGLRVTV